MSEIKHNLVEMSGVIGLITCGSYCFAATRLLDVEFSLLLGMAERESWKIQVPVNRWEVI